VADIKVLHVVRALKVLTHIALAGAGGGGRGGAKDSGRETVSEGACVCVCVWGGGATGRHTQSPCQYCVCECGKAECCQKLQTPKNITVMISKGLQNLVSYRTCPYYSPTPSLLHPKCRLK